MYHQLQRFLKLAATAPKTDRTRRLLPERLCLRNIVPPNSSGCIAFEFVLAKPHRQRLLYRGIVNLHL